jgi:hypothetical protein
MPIPIPPGTIHIPQPFPNSPVVGTSPIATGVSGQSNAGVGVWGQSIGEEWVQGGPPPTDGVLGDGRNGVHGRSASPADSGVWGESTGGGYGVSGRRIAAINRVRPGRRGSGATIPALASG